MKKSKTNQLEKLFIKWKDKQVNESEKDWKKTKGTTKYVSKSYFCEDGIIDEKVFEKEKIKVLFITNEANDDINGLDENIDSSRVKAFKEYHDVKKDDWKGKLRERVCAIYKVIINNYDLHEYEVSYNFAFMNLNKRAGTKKITDKHIERYVELYKDEIISEIQIINPDIIVWLGINTYYLNQYLDAYLEDKRCYMNINSKRVPILRMPHTSYAFTLKDKPMDKFENKINGKLATRIQKELERFGIRT